MNIEVYSHGFLQDFLSLFDKIIQGEVGREEIEQRVIRATKPKKTKTKKAKPEIKKPTPKSDLFNIKPLPVLSECCKEKVYLLPPNILMCGNCNREFGL